MENDIQPNTSPATPPPQAPVLPSKNWLKILLFILSGLFVIAMSLFIGIQIGKSQTSNQQPITAQPTALPTTTNPTTNPTTSWKVYENNTYNFSFQYPGSWIELTTEDDKTRGNPGYTNRNIIIETDKKEIVSAVVFDGKADKSNDKDWAANIDIGNNKSVLITYVQCMGPGCLEGQKDIKIFKQILSTFKFIN